MKKELELYIHIPFCVKKCDYCDFLSGTFDMEECACYVEALITEIQSCRELAREYRVGTVFLGGGTPSVLEAVQTEAVFAALWDVFKLDREAEITTELNPGTVTIEKLEAYRGIGINRLSIGLQSADNKELERLGRIHTYEDFLRTYQMARENGFDNINIDLISAIPGQTVGSWTKTLQQVLRLNPPPEHISAYSLIVEEGTPFWDVYGEKSGAVPDVALPDEEEERRIYRETKRILEQEGYRRYEISNYARSGYECRHNLGYWERREYLGIGLGAASLIGEQRFSNTAEMKNYLVQPGAAEDKNGLSRQEQMEEFMFLGLRKMSGVSKVSFEKQFGCEMEKEYGTELDSLKRSQLIKEEKGCIRLTEEGINVGNHVFASFLKE